MRFGVAVADVLEAEVTVIANEPACKTEEKFRERRMDVEVVLSEDVVRRELAKVDLVEAVTCRSCEERRDAHICGARTRPGPDG